MAVCNTVHLYERKAGTHTWEHVGFAYPKVGNAELYGHEFLYLTDCQYRQLLRKVVNDKCELKLIDKESGIRYYPAKGEPIVRGWILYNYELANGVPHAVIFRGK